MATVKKKYKNSLGLKIALWLSLLLIVVFAVFTATNVMYQRDLIEVRELELSSTLSSVLLESIRYWMIGGDQDKVQSQLEYVADQNTGLAIQVIDSAGVIKRSTETEKIGLPFLSASLEGVLNGGEVQQIEMDPGKGYSIFSSLIPIANTSDCTTCHFDQRSI